MYTSTGSMYTFSTMDSTRATDGKSLRARGLGAFFRPVDDDAVGISEPAIRVLLRRGVVERVSRGLYRIVGSDASQHYSLAGVCARVPRGVLCLLTALQYHGIGTRVSPEIWLGIPHGQRAARIELARVRFVRFSGVFLTEGIDEIRVEGVAARITNPARTVIDCLRLSRLIDRETALEAMRETLRSRTVTSNSLQRMARACGVFDRVRTALEVLGA